MHRTESVDYGIVLEGEITLVLDDSEVTLRRRRRRRAARHRPRLGQPGYDDRKVVFVLVDGAFDQTLLDTLPAGAVDGLMHGGPKG